MLLFRNVYLFLAFLFYKPEAIPTVFKDVTMDHQRMFDMIKTSGLKWVAILPPQIASLYFTIHDKTSHSSKEISRILYYHTFVDTPKSKYNITFDCSAGRAISKHDLGAFLIECLKNPQYHQKICGIATA